MQATLRAINALHVLSATSPVDVADDGTATLSVTSVATIQAALCPVPGCACGGFLKQSSAPVDSPTARRLGQSAALVINGDVYRVVGWTGYPNGGATATLRKALPAPREVRQ